jgi:ParB-like chromosome segregation protein Spo0J
MCSHSRRRITLTLSVAITIGTMLSTTLRTLAQNPELQEKLAAIKQSSAANKQALAHYTWLEQQTISLKGEVKKTEQFQVRIGPDGQQQKTALNPQAPAEPSGGRIKRRIVEKKTDEFQEYGQQIAALGKQYAQLDPQKLQQAYQQGNVSMQPNGEGGTVSLIIKSYLKPNDSVTMVFNQQQKAVQSVQVASYLTDPSDAVTIAVQFAKLPDGTNHVATMQVNGVSKQLGVQIQNSTYQPI